MYSQTGATEVCLLGATLQNNCALSQFEELQEVKIAFAMITNKGLTQHSVDLDSDLLAFIFTFVTNQSYWEYRAVDD